MSNFSAIINVKLAVKANSKLEALGFGPNNFSIPAYKKSKQSHAFLHSWYDQAFYDAVSAIKNVLIFEDNDPQVLVQEAVDDVGATLENV
jgi:hypothetical protein